jgi:hypothetical protein
MTNEEFIKLLEERGDTVYIVDRGLMRFAKFAVTLLAMFGIVGVFFFGWDIKKAADEAKQARFDTERTLSELTETKAKLVAAKNDLDGSKADFVKFIENARGELQFKLEEAAQSSRRMIGYEQEIAIVRLRLLKLGDSKGLSEVVTAATKADQTRPTTAPPAGATIKLALVSDVNELTITDLTRVAASLQKQVIRDLKPIWSIDATVEPFVSLDRVPKDYWPIIVKRDIGTVKAAGMHIDKDGQPFALVTYEEDWTLTASHEMLDMLVDPFGNRFILGPSPDPADHGAIVKLLTEICQPVEGKEHGYLIDGILVSDFVTPAVYDAIDGSGTKYSFQGHAKSPRKALKGGFMSWMVPETKVWHQALWLDGDEPSYRDIGKFD